uniref:DNA binding protein putative n=1 Tax=Albugo laibachii Nc14 TaxID=890382 RepID=F0WDK9_9STRA|nr:DNA binding protein putative [Albugo laibachii Nc14]|eukprot:CCA19284.1 DNA binding protein putative [Albugo laibachii Nc14]
MTIQIPEASRSDVEALYGEAASVNVNAVENGRIALKEITLGYEKWDVLNMDETAFFYFSMPVKSITKDRIAGRKHQKKRLTVALCSNADGTTKLPLLFVGSGKNRAAFKGTPMNSLDCNTKAQKKLDDVNALSAMVVATERADAYCWSPHPPSRRQRLIAPDGRVAIERESTDASTKYDCLSTASRRGNNQLVKSPDYQDSASSYC